MMEKHTPQSVESSIYRELMNYNRDLIVENENLKNELREFRKSWEELKNEAFSLRDELRAQNELMSKFQKELDSAHPLEQAGDVAGDFFKYIDSLTAPKMNSNRVEQIDAFPEVKKQAPKKQVKKGTQVLIDPVIGDKFKQTLATQGLSLTQVARAMMLIFIDRGRYRNIIVDRALKRNWIPNNVRKTIAFAWGYPEELGKQFNGVLRTNKLNQYQAIEIMMEEYCQNHWMQKLVVEYIDRVKKEY